MARIVRATASSSATCRLAVIVGLAVAVLLALHRVVVPRMSRVSSIDATGAQVLDDAIRRLKRRGVLVLLSGMRPGHDRALEALGVADRLRSQGAVFPGSVSVIEHARAHVVQSTPAAAGA